MAAATLVVVVGSWWHLEWCRCNALGLIKKVALHRARLAVGWYVTNNLRQFSLLPAVEW